jgi:2-polyprenyl-3-methyl-5-hydroxy-6-metoxy-1,4-benzoquinol methylase
MINMTMSLSYLSPLYRSFGLAVLGAEYIARLVPVGTHDWNKFLTPVELQRFIVHPLSVNTSSAAIPSPTSASSTTLASTTSTSGSDNNSNEDNGMASEMTINELRGLAYNPLTRRWSWTNDTDCNYILFASKRG